MKRKTHTLICGFFTSEQHPDSTGFLANCQRFRKYLRNSSIAPRWRNACDVLNGIMIRRCPLSLILAAALASSPARSVNAESLWNQAPQSCQVRSADHRINGAVEQGLRDSATFRALVDRINASDVVVYLAADVNGLPTGVDGRLTFLSAAGGFRYVVVHVNSRLSTPRLVALIGHELQHAREIADTVAIIDALSMAREYAAGLGYRNLLVTNDRRTFDSRAAIRAGEQVLREVLTGE